MAVAELLNQQIEGLILPESNNEPNNNEGIQPIIPNENINNNNNNSNIEPNIPLIKYPGFINENEKQFGLNLDIFGRFAPNKLPKKTYKPIYHYHNQKNIKFDYKSIWLELNTNELICKHINKEYTILTDINKKYSIKMRRILWPISLQYYSINNEFKYYLYDMIKYFRFIIILIHGGRFGIGLFHGNELIKHKIIKKYVCRKKQGKRQANYMKENTRSIKRSAGTFKRAAMEKNLAEKIHKILSDWQTIIDGGCDKIFIHAPNDVNERAIYGNKDEQTMLYPEINGELNIELSKKRLKEILIKNENKVVNKFRIYKKDKRIERIPFTTYKISLNEVIRVHYVLSTFWLTVNE